MNVTPVTMPGSPTSGQIEARTRGQQAPAPAADRGHVSQRDLASAERPEQSKAAAFLESVNEIDAADRQKAEQLREFVVNEKFSLRTYHDEQSGRHIVEVRDQTTGDVVTQYPSEELIRLYSSFRQSLVDQQV